MSEKKKGDKKPGNVHEDESQAFIINLEDDLVFLGVLNKGTGLSSIRLTKDEADQLGEFLTLSAKVASRDKKPKAFKNVSPEMAEGVGKTLKRLSKLLKPKK